MSFDEVDRANILAERERDACIAAVRNSQRVGSGRATCLDCEGEIEPARRAVNQSAVRCIGCQRELEQTR
ncbi:TraR/DksA C4-type zinc finger protein [Pseudovibrio sp. Tun.PSC04-5.I4]|uniref:TraR/DksA C4-type zinc finger protein n=1 Tax=Pseudovibrio sp. Tun.PSC04-5.I4 TaxID=1798213 RepID=UPI000886C852|nr:TraR/DksA C4-type zinc finger protein [Pseudovibrio sp. Tun.PSC04-5.I4]SDR07887.1 phage/conjugal plasmid C-4 type zinc finger protein, TraR family [Pseudovibrio sp. Tun.PSC04-5.I4]